MLLIIPDVTDQLHFSCLLLTPYVDPLDKTTSIDLTWQPCKHSQLYIRRVPSLKGGQPLRAILTQVGCHCCCIIVRGQSLSASHGADTAYSGPGGRKHIYLLSSPGGICFSPRLADYLPRHQRNCSSLSERKSLLPSETKKLSF